MHDLTYLCESIYNAIICEHAYMYTVITCLLKAWNEKRSHQSTSNF